MRYNLLGVVAWCCLPVKLVAQATALFHVLWLDEALTNFSHDFASPASSKRRGLQRKMTGTVYIVTRSSGIKIQPRDELERGLHHDDDRLYQKLIVGHA